MALGSAFAFVVFPWRACESAMDVRATVLVTAVMFALLHGLNGLGWLELPSRFLYGVGFGVLRAHTGSLMPGIVAHCSVNALALVVH